jgi:hypothetical protein
MEQADQPLNVSSMDGLGALVEKRCPLRIPRHTRAGCCTWDTFIVGFADAWPRWFQAEPTHEQWQWARRDWREGNTGWEAAHNAQRRIKERNTPAAIQERNTKAVARSLILVAKRGA